MYHTITTKPYLAWTFAHSWWMITMMVKLWVVRWLSFADDQWLVDRTLYDWGMGEKARKNRQILHMPVLL